MPLRQIRRVRPQGFDALEVLQALRNEIRGEDFLRSHGLRETYALSSFSNNRDRLLGSEIASAFFDAVTVAVSNIVRIRRLLAATA